MRNPTFAPTGRLPRPRREEGFTLVEVMAAMGIITIALLGLGYTATVGFTDVALSRQRQGANGLANQAMEQTRALAFDTVALGLKTSDLGGDPAITQCGSPAVACYGGERIVQSSNPPNVVPLVPHRRALTVGSTAYTVSTYVTYYNNNLSGKTYRVTVVASWAAPARRGVASSVVTQSVFYSGTGCQSTQTHPFAGPCQPFLYGSAAAAAGQVNITGTIAGIALDHATLWMPEVSSNQQIEQISSIQGVARVSGVALQLTGQTEQVVGRQVITSKADDDPAQPGATYSTAQLPPPPMVGGSLTQSGGGNAITVSAGAGGDAAATTSTAAAGATSACPDRNAVARTDGLPCGNSNAKLAATLSASVQLVAGTVSLGQAPLVTVSPPAGTGPNRVAFGNRDLKHEVAAPAAECPATSGDGCLHVDVLRSTGQLSIGGLPPALSVLAPLGWTGSLITISPATASVSSETGTGTSPPSATSSGTISYWNGVGYTTIPILSGGTPTVIPVSLSIPGGLTLPGVTLTMTASVVQATTSITDPAGCATPCTRTQAAATATSPLIDLQYQVTASSVTVADLAVHVDLGTALAQSSYQPAPSGA